MSKSANSALSVSRFEAGGPGVAAAISFSLDHFGVTDLPRGGFRLN
ncbi:hypothetical protein [Roseiconus lacunae]|uniref:Uncharacterized protein n=1 Tax=Roseiconus lacunae TaxID=2605694 RepID=A0ABT7PNN7_9BACT|nr:hypothetical protein [Roseiconus lacunae]MDM4018120.1 hypothetical protein [Roseiconus lacunae]